MVNATQHSTLSLTSVDDFLGDRQGRFFGEGFKRVTHTVNDITVTAEGGRPRLEAVGGVRLPESWSRKGETDQRPHLSTIDVMVLGARLTGLHLAHAHDVRPNDPFRIRELTIRAGNAPQEDDLGAFPVVAEHVSTEPGGEGNTTTVDCRVGALDIRVVAEHRGESVPSDVAGYYSSAESLPGPWNTAPYGVSHHVRSQFLNEIEIDLSEPAADGELTVIGAPDDLSGVGHETTMIDHFVAALQLGQVLLYKLDDVDRADSNTLWMRRTTFEPVSDSGSGRFRVDLENSRLLPSKQGTWRSADVVARYGGRLMRCSVAHLLPVDREGVVSGKAGSL
ncbi:avirulence D protein (AvrD) [Actinopolyspora xinjiangensis]|uniref:Avirulence D protein (AvrD) n=1 Tax=Actinopolyspora xinjiangensis TaxID=405564 RepID=A0A1H0VLX8_9ACTN|nr:AvrD family protein [Actinopolyspora xinjiangensis]SDP79291.1 avirulence D protein (AvrD) [Actinopolyspora xinjiangensis]